MKRPLIEACVDSYASAMAASRAGADRLELCAHLVIGGTTPTHALFRQVQRDSGVPINVLIRPRFGDFLYTEPELEEMCEEIAAFRDLGANGVQPIEEEKFVALGADMDIIVMDAAAVKNMIANLTGMICDGAKPSCSMKLTSGVSTAVLSAMMAMDGHCVTPVEGIIEEDVDKCIRNLTAIGRDGMNETDRLVLGIMTHKC